MIIFGFKKDLAFIFYLKKYLPTNHTNITSRQYIHKILL